MVYGIMESRSMFDILCRRENYLSILNGADGPVYSTKDMLEVSNLFCKYRLGFELNLTYTWVKPFGQMRSWSLKVKTNLVEKPFSKEEIKEAIMSSYASGPPWSRWFVLFIPPKFLGSDKK